MLPNRNLAFYDDSFLMPCDYFINDQCTHAPARDELKYGPTPSPGVHRVCRYNTTGGAWPEGGAPPVQPTVTAWPTWAKMMRMVRQHGEAGLGDTIARLIGPIGGDVFKAWYLRTTGQDCGCGGRQDVLNARYPYMPINAK